MNPSALNSPTSPPHTSAAPAAPDLADHADASDAPQFAGSVDVAAVADAANVAEAPAAAAGPLAPDSVEHAVPAHLPLGPLTTSELHGVASRSQIREHYRRMWHGMYRRVDQLDDLALRSRALARDWPRGVLRGRSAAVFWGDDSSPADTVPEIWLPSTRHSRPGRIFRYGALPAVAVTELDGMRLTAPLRTCRDLAVDLDFEDAVVSIERLCAMVAELPAQIRAAAEHPSGRRGRRFATVVRACDPRSTSAFASRIRLELARAGFDRFRHGHQVRLLHGTIEVPLVDTDARCVVYPVPAPVSPAVRHAAHTSGDTGLNGSAGHSGSRASTRIRSEKTIERHRGWLQEAGWTVLVVRESSPEPPAVFGEQNSEPLAPEVLPPEAVPGMGKEGAALRAAQVLAARWPDTEIRRPDWDGPTGDPHGIWGSAG